MSGPPAESGSGPAPFPATGARWTVGRLLAGAFAVAIAVMLTGGATSYFQIDKLVQERVAVEHTDHVLDNLSGLMTLISDAETGQRGYLITGDESYLAPYSEALSGIKANLATLDRLSAGNARERAALAKLRAPVRDKLAELDETIVLRRVHGFAAAQAVVLTDRGARSMATIRQLLGQMRSEEGALLAARERASEDSAKRTKRFILWGALLATLLYGLAAWAVARRITVPVADVTAAARRVRAGDLSAPAQVTGPVEIAEMAAAVNAALDAVIYSRDRALSATKAKSVFLATMSHEMRTPLNAVIGMTDLLLDTDLAKEQREFTEIVHNSGEAVLAVINDVLDFTKIESGDLQLDAQPFEPRASVESAVEVMAVAACNKGLELVAIVDESCPELVVGDASRFRQVIVNLVGNAVKFTADGEVVVEVRADELTAGPEGAVRLEVSVRDTGIGIPADRTDQLFQSFSQVDGSTTRAHGGSGLGLVISRRLVEAMGGELRVESRVGAGSTFTFTAVLRRGADLRVAPAGSLAGKSALVIDDKPANRRALRLMLRGWGMTCTEADTPAAALELMRTGGDFDVALLDMAMEGMDGRDLVLELREPTGGAEVPLVLLTSLQRRTEWAQETLCAATLTKPLRSGMLREALLTALDPGAMAAAAETPGRRSADAPAAGGAPLEVLLAEDNAVNQKVAQLLLSKLGHRVHTVDNGLEAVEAVRRAAYDVVLMDVQMPTMDGLEATRLIRAELPASRQPSIVAVTASVLVEDRLACARAGMDAYLAKPMRPQELRDVLNRISPQVHGPAGPDPDVAPQEHPTTTPVTGAPLPPREAAIRRRLAELAGPDPEDDKDVFSQLLRSFIARGPVLLEQLNDAVQRNASQDIEQRAHSLKGAAANLGGEDLALLLSNLELQGRVGQLGQLADDVERVREEMAALNASLAAVASDIEGGLPQVEPTVA